MDITIKDAKRLWSSIWHKEELINKKRRWLMQSPSKGSEGVLKKFKKPKFLKNVFLAESYIRSDEVSPEAVKMHLEKSYRSASDNVERLNVVQNYTLPCDIQKLGSYFQEPTNLKKFHSALDLMNNNALSLLANLVTENQNNFDKTRPKMKKIIKNHFPDILSASNNMESFAPLLQLSEILRDPRNYRGKLPSFLTPACSYSLSSIYQALELVENMPIFVLSELNRNLIGKTVVPKFPPPKVGYNKDVLADRIKKRCWKKILDINDGNSMPRELAKALSIILLFYKQKTKRSDVSTSTFLPFSIEKVNLQNDILQALWSLPKATPYQLKDLRSILGLKLEDDSRGFMGHFKKYLMQYLFECDEIDLPPKIFDILAVLNDGSCIKNKKKKKKKRKKKKEGSCMQPQICPKKIIGEDASRETIEEETEAVLNLSSALKQILSNLQSKTNCDDKTEEGLESDSETESNGFALVENVYCSSPGKYQCQQKDFCENDDVETTGDSMLGTYFTSAIINKCDILPSEPSKSIMHGSVTTLKEEQDEVLDFQPNCRQSMGSVLQTTQQASEDSRDISLKEFCDEISLESYRLIDDMLDRFLLGGCNVNAINRRQLTGEASSSATFQDDVGIKILVQSARDKLPSLPKRCIHRVKNFIKQS